MTSEAGVGMGAVILAVAEAVKQQHEELRREIAMVQNVSEREVLAAGGALAKIFEELSDHTARLAALKQEESSGESKGSFAAVLGRFSDQLPALLNALLGEANTQSRLAAGASVQIREVTDVADDMARIALWCRVVASNARVEAAHAGELGRGFAVVADTLATISTDIARATRTVQDRAKTVKGIVGEMAQGAAKVADEGRERTLCMTKAVSDCQSAYQKAVVGSIEQFEQSAAGTRDRSNAALGHLQFQDRLQQALDHVVAGNARIVAGLVTLASELGESGTPTSTDELRETLRQLFSDASSLAVVEDLAGGERSDGDIQFL